MEYEVIVSGGGIVGLCAAISMAQQGHSVAILDGGDFNVPEEDFRRVYAINAASQRLLTTLGVWKRLELTQCTPYQKMQVRDQCSAAQIAFDCRELAMPQLGHIIGENTLKQALMSIARQESNLHLLAGQSIQHLEPCVKGLSLHVQQQRLKTRLLMVAEGVRSTTRDLLNVGVHQYSYHQQALTARVRCAQAHQKIARQIFFALRTAGFFTAAG